MQGRGRGFDSHTLHHDYLVGSVNMICKTCGQEKDISKFYIYQRRNKVKPYSSCIECTKLRSKHNYDSKINAINTLKHAIGCKKCGEKRYYMLDFHHRNPNEKELVISDCSRRSLHSLLEELKKCDVLCANCHREWHYLHETIGIEYDAWLGEMA